MFGTMSVLELVWILVAVIGASITSVNTQHAWSDYRFIKRNNIFNGRRIVARTAAWTEALRLTIQIIFIAIGVLAALIPDPVVPHLPLKVVILGYLVRLGLIISSILLTIKSELLRRMRRAIHP